MTGNISRGKAARLAAVLLLALLVAFPISSAYLNPAHDMTDYAEEKTCYCHGADPTSDVSIVIDVEQEVAYTPDNRSVDVAVGVFGEPTNLTGFGLFLNASEDDSGVRWTPRFSNGTVDVPDGEILDIIRVNQTSVWTVGPVTSEWFNLSFKPGNTDQDIVLSVVGMRADNSGDETGDLWNVAEMTITVRRQRMVNLTVGVTNLEEVSAASVLVDFYIDGEYIGNDTITNLGGGVTENASVAWDATFYKDGKYKLRAVIDPDGHITELDKDNNEVTRTIWLGGPPEEDDLTLYYGLGSMAVGAVIIVTVFWFWRRRQYRF
ncbi:MAG: hypothetical protein JSW25_05360 [Thermoplasmata archaeon]|nr:MAG: hypothetical protein JSW25_05360 [Thermoplasmata archaeon]